MYDPGESDQTIYPGNVHCKHHYSTSTYSQVHYGEGNFSSGINALKYDVMMCFNEGLDLNLCGH